jgi:2-haloacid dehalogenase
MAEPLQAILFDVFGTLVDWRTSVTRQLATFGRERNVDIAWERVADDWRAEYQPSMDAVRSGRRNWTILDELHRESVERVLARHGIIDLDEQTLVELARFWHRLDPWPDVVPGLSRLRTRFTVGTLSNGNTALLGDLRTFGALPLDVLLGAETAQAYKPLPEAYLRNVRSLGFEPPQVMLVAAHNTDLAAARAQGLQTGFVPRRTEYGPAQRNDLSPTDDWDVIALDCLDLATRLCGDTST